MCAPAALGLLSFASGALQAVVGFQAAEADYSAKAAAWKQNYVNSIAADQNDEHQITLRQLQEGDALTQKQQLSQVDQATRQAEVSVQAAGAGVSGQSVDYLVADVARKDATNRATDTANWQMTARQLQTQQEATVTTAQSRINSVPIPVAPNPLSMIIGIAGAGIKAFGGA